MNGLSLVGELACGAETIEEVNGIILGMAINIRYNVIGVCNWAAIVRQRRWSRHRSREARRRLRKRLRTTTAVALNLKPQCGPLAPPVLGCRRSQHELLYRHPYFHH
jgi:hypothetical protein